MIARTHQLPLHGPRRTRTRFARPVAAAVAGLLVGAPSGDAAVALRGTPTCRTQVFIGFGAFSMAAPAGLQAGDVMIATLRRSDLFALGGSGPSGWTGIASVSDNAASAWFRVATAGDVGSSWTFANMGGFASQVTGAIVAFSGADPGAPIGQGAKVTGTGSSYALPVVSATRAGSMRYSAATSAASATALFSGGMTEACDQAGSGASIANAVQAVDAGPVAARTVTTTASGAYVGQTLIVQPATQCATGARTLSAPSAITFPPTALDGTDETLLTSGALQVSDLSDSAAGWNVSATSTTFTSGSNALPPGSVSITAVTPAAGGLSCVAPLPSVSSYPLDLPAGSPAPAATKIFGAGVGTGMGVTDLDVAFALHVPASARIGTYTSSWTFTLAAGP
ncbi:MAG: hypothetical protein PGN13_10720 [Patulibacter minatonensis]